MQCGRIYSRNTERIFRRLRFCLAENMISAKMTGFSDGRLRTKAHYLFAIVEVGPSFSGLSVGH